ncbi:hypothetical protein [Pontibacter fetidus]|uniref:STAS/SEC14 domain-containing protein n=1 Tax=Pontibacter fetidus TaxID=2700082 RepID=A0A6B2H9Q0_9BACT|nr:hypothetical protein [Pontibacter fetidus]NDK56282.1 hypothetical protein [Pontibacter fetidus]
MPRIDLRKENGDVFCSFERMPDNAYTYALWQGRQTIDTVKKGGNFFVDRMREQSCSKLLNSHKELIGPWDMANDWITTEWTPKVIELGLRYMAQVLAPGIYGQTSFHLLHQRIGDLFEIKMFDDEASASAWLLSLPD